MVYSTESCRPRRIVFNFFVVANNSEKKTVLKAM